jgi:tRNA (guanine37-N1)-methyltransferase
MCAMRFDILTLFPQMFEGPFDQSIIRRAKENGLVEVHIHNIRDFLSDRHKVVDDYPYGGGAGMVMKPEPLFAATEAVQAMGAAPGWVILLSAQGRLLGQDRLQKLSALPRLTILCGHYEGVDERVVEHLVDEEISIGDYILSGGEIPAMVLVDGVTRLIPGVVGSEQSLVEESHGDGLLEYPQYTRPAVFRDWPVPEVLLSGNHAAIERWRRRQRVERTAQRRPDLLGSADLSEEERRLAQDMEAGSCPDL